MSVNCYFRSLHRCSVRFKSGLWLGHPRTVRDLKPLQHCLDCMLQADVLLRGESLLLSLVMWSTFFQSMLHFGWMVLASWWAVLGDLPRELKYFLISPEIFFLSFKCCLTKSICRCAGCSTHFTQTVFPPASLNKGLVAGWLKLSSLQQKTSEALLKWPLVLGHLPGPSWIANSNLNDWWGDSTLFFSISQSLRPLYFYLKKSRSFLCSWPDLCLTTVLLWRSRQRFLDLFGFCADTWTVRYVSFLSTVLCKGLRPGLD